MTFSLLRASFRFTAATAIAAATAASLGSAACSSDESDEKGSGVGQGDGGDEDGGGTGGKGSGGAKATGGSPSAGGAPAIECAYDPATPDECDTCLRQNCCDAIIECDGDAKCKTALSEHKDCAAANPDDVAQCFGDFVVKLHPDAADGGGTPTAVEFCIITKCPGECDGPPVL